MGVKYGGYHCGGAKSGKRAHPYIRISAKEFDENVRAYLNSLKFEEGFMDALELHLVAKYHTREKEILVEASAIGRTVSDLKAEIAQKIDALGFAKSPVVREKLEADIERLDAEVKQAESQRTHIEVTEKSVRAFVRYAKYLMEHPAEILTDADNLHSRRQLLSLFFEETPTYNEILNGTPKLQPLFRLSEDFKTNKTQLVTLRGFGQAFKNCRRSFCRTTLPRSQACSLGARSGFRIPAARRPTSCLGS